MGDKWKTSVNSCGPRHPEWDASPETEAKSCGPGMQRFERRKNPIQVNLFGENQAKAPRVGDKCGRQVWETSVDSCSPKNPEWETSVGDKWETSVNSCSTRQPEWETTVGDKLESSGRQVQNHAAQGTQSGRQV